MDPATVTILVSAVSAVLLAFAGWITARAGSKLNRVEATLGRKNGSGTVTEMSESVLAKLDDAEAKLGAANSKIDMVNVEVAGKLDVVQNGVGALLSGQQQMTERVDTLEKKQLENTARLDAEDERLKGMEARLAAINSHVELLDSIVTRSIRSQ